MVLADHLVVVPREGGELPLGDACGTEEHDAYRLHAGQGQNLLRFLHDLLSLGVVPAFVVADKRFCAAAKRVETFLDPEHNPGADWLETGNNVLRPKVAARFAEYPLDV